MNTNISFSLDDLNITTVILSRLTMLTKTLIEWKELFIKQDKIKKYFNSKFWSLFRHDPFFRPLLDTVLLLSHIHVGVEQWTQI